MYKLAALTCAVFLALTLFAHAVDFPSVSGVAALDSQANTFVLISDVKNDPKLDSPPRPRLYIAHLAPDKTQVAPVGDGGRGTVSESWGSEELPNDLEAISPIPGMPNHYLVAESGYQGEKYGRLFHIEIQWYYEGFQSRVISVAHIPQGLLRSDLEGIALAAKADGSLVLVLSERGGSGAYSPGWLWWGNFNLDTGEFTRTEEAQWGVQLTWPEKTSNPWARPCTDLWLDGAGYLWASGAQDPGDSGPFRSVVYRIGRFDPNQGYAVMYEMAADMVWHVDGLKVEALGPAVVPWSILTYYTDDEAFGGIWRPLPPAEPQPDRTPYYGEYGG